MNINTSTHTTLTRACAPIGDTVCICSMYTCKVRITGSASM